MYVFLCYMYVCVRLVCICTSHKEFRHVPFKAFGFEMVEGRPKDDLHAGLERVALLGRT